MDYSDIWKEQGLQRWILRLQGLHWDFSGVICHPRMYCQNYLKQILTLKRNTRSKLKILISLLQCLFSSSKALILLFGLLFSLFIPLHTWNKQQLLYVFVPCCYQTSSFWSIKHSYGPVNQASPLQSGLTLRKQCAGRIFSSFSFPVAHSDLTFTWLRVREKTTLELSDGFCHSARQRIISSVTSSWQRIWENHMLHLLKCKWCMLCMKHSTVLFYMIMAASIQGGYVACVYHPCKRTASEESACEHIKQKY